VWVARNRRRAQIGGGLGFAASMLVLGPGLAVVRSVYLASAPASVLPSDAATVLYDDLVRFIKDGPRLLLVVGLIIAAAAFFGGGWAYTHRHGLRVAAVAIAALVFVFWDQPTWQVALVITILLLAVLELIARPPAEPQAQP
jgi:hypothetical protein